MKIKENVRRRSVAMGIVFTIVWNGFVPYGAYMLLKPHMPSLAALLLATLLPLTENIVSFLKRRQLDAFGAIMLGTFALAAGLAALGGSERLILIRESFVTGAVGALFLLSLGFRRPLIFHLAGRFVSQKSAAAYEERWTHPYIRFVFRFMTIVWGAALLGEAALRTVLVVELPTEQFLALSNPVLYGILVATIGWTYLYRKHAMRKFAQMQS